MQILYLKALYLFSCMHIYMQMHGQDSERVHNELWTLVSHWKEIGMKEVAWETRVCSLLIFFINVCIVWIFSKTILLYDLCISEGN